MSLFGESANKENSQSGRDETVEESKNQLESPQSKFISQSEDRENQRENWCRKRESHRGSISFAEKIDATADQKS
jgi:hypothetical protein